ncbi:hypothetical protein HPB50_023104 [Hyalomma asiaticum]|uniref:Uncharacterized protein n=1 Tax=Hyalomma asiaticum TaxID=266040 RepID=A0ACB7TQ35_HYAAI|nr:hypothetical protein HPB50_023104 [Hyalomma asiaticum]
MQGPTNTHDRFKLFRNDATPPNTATIWHKPYPEDAPTERLGGSARRRERPHGLPNLFRQYCAVSGRALGRLDLQKRAIRELKMASGSEARGHVTTKPPA